MRESNVTAAHFFSLYATIHNGIESRSDLVCRRVSVYVRIATDVKRDIHIIRTIEIAAMVAKVDDTNTHSKDEALGSR